MNTQRPRRDRVPIAAMRFGLLAGVGIIGIIGIIGPAGCTHRVAIEPIRIEPIFITLDVNLKVDRALDDFFDFQDQASPAPDAPMHTESAGGSSS